MKKKQKKQINIKVKICFAMMTSVFLVCTVILSCLIPRYTELITETTTSSMRDYSTIYAELIDSSLSSLTSAIRNSRPMTELADNPDRDSSQSAANNKEETTNQAASNDKEEAAADQNTDAIQGMPSQGMGSGFQPQKQNASQALSNIVEEYSDYISCMSYIDLQGNIKYSLDETKVNQNVSSEEYFQAVLFGKSYAMSNTMTTENGTEFILAFSLINSDDELAGVITATVSSSYLGHILTSAGEEASYSETGMQLISSKDILGISGTTVYICDQNNIVLNASDSRWIAFDVTEESLKDNNSNEETTISTYVSEGDTYYLAQAHLDESGWMFCVDIPRADIFSSLDTTKNLTIALSSTVLLIALISSYFIANGISKPIKKTTETLEYFSKLELNKIDLTNVKRANDETGAMINSIDIAAKEIKKVISLVEESSNSIYTNAKKLSEISDQLQENAQDNSSVAEELSAGMEETASTQDHIRNDITQIQSTSAMITNKINDGVVSCEHIISGAESLNRETKQASELTEKIYHDVKADVARALEKAKAVEKINLMANSIMDISSQTSLLALNASIEAARAGEAGRGFAIVAEQIGSLANQSSDTVSNISGIIDEVNSAVTDMTASLEKTLNLMETQIFKDYEKFINVSNQYSDQSNDLRVDMSEIAESITNFMNALDSMSESIKESADTLELASENTITLTEKNNQVAAIAYDTNHMAQENTSSAEQLNEILKVFKL